MSSMLFADTSGRFYQAILLLIFLFSSADICFNYPPLGSRVQLCLLIVAPLDNES
jgi:hypothetical protein